MSDVDKVAFLREDGTLKVIFPTYFNAQNINPIALSIKKEVAGSVNIIFDLTNVESLDSSGALYLIDKEEIYQHRNLQIIGLNDRLEMFYNLCKDHFPKTKPKLKRNSYHPLSLMYKIGEFFFYSLNMLLSFLSFLGEMALAIWKNIINPKKIRLNALCFHIEQNGINALPIISITSFLIGVVIAYQGATLLAQFGANIFIVDFVGIASTRELAPLIVAIVIAGRSASAYTAEIGVMKITDEIDAMKTLGFSLWDFLVLPRTYALIISLPILVFFADVLSIFGGMLIASIQLDINYVEFLNRFQEQVDLKHIVIGLVKAPFFGIIIAIVGCFRGFQITGNTQNVGKYTTLSVVNAIFWVIAFDAIASIFLTQLGI